LSCVLFTYGTCASVGQHWCCPATTMIPRLHHLPNQPCESASHERACKSGEMTQLPPGSCKGVTPAGREELGGLGARVRLVGLARTQIQAVTLTHRHTRRNGCPAFPSDNQVTRWAALHRLCIARHSTTMGGEEVTATQSSTCHASRPIQRHGMGNVCTFSSHIQRWR